MITNSLGNIIWRNKMQARKRRLKSILDYTENPCNLQDFLIKSNEIALEYFNRNKNPIKRLWEYHNLEPHCYSYATYTYAAFLSLTEQMKRTDLQKEARIVGGFYISNKARGRHLWIEKRENNIWIPFETIPEMREIPAFYRPWFSFQMTENECKAKSEMSGGISLLIAYSFINS